MKLSIPNDVHVQGAGKKCIYSRKNTTFITIHQFSGARAIRKSSRLGISDDLSF